MSNAYFITDIRQAGNHIFTITWNDGLEYSYRLCDLQRRCPCAGCQETVSHVDEDVQAIRIVSVGRYALRIDFTLGCSAGIYSYDLLRSFIRNSKLINQPLSAYE